jgi:hypothetical protein
MTRAELAALKIGDRVHVAILGDAGVVVVEGVVFCISANQVIVNMDCGFDIDGSAVRHFNRKTGKARVKGMLLQILGRTTQTMAATASASTPTAAAEPQITTKD